MERQNRKKKRSEIIRLFCVLLPVMLGSYFLTKWIRFGYGPFYPQLGIDRAVPFFPPFILIYIGSFVSWFAGFCMLVRYSEADLYEFSAAALLCFAVSAAVYILYPVEIVRPDASGSGLWLWLVRFIYAVDTPQNLFPSMHCMLSWLYYTAIRGKKAYPAALRIGWLIFAVLVFASTLFVKQHYFVDFLGGVALAEIGMWISRRRNWGKRFYRRLNRTAEKE